MARPRQRAGLTPSLASVFTFGTLLALALPASARRSSRATDAVQLQDIQALTFHAGRETTHRRVPALPQLTCTGGSARGRFEPDSVRCTNSGSSYDSADVEWTCTADLPPEVRLGATDVVCEGYDSADDAAVLKGSCALEYRLILTDLGREKFGGGSSWSGKGGEGGGATDVVVQYVFWAIFLGVAFFIVRAFLREYRANGGVGGRRPGNGWGGGGGAGDGGDDDPPPPYDPRPPRYAKTTPRATPNRGWGSSWFNQPRQTQNQGWRPGFWTGAAGGAAAGYFAGQRGNNSRPSMRERSYDPGEGSSFRPNTGRTSSGPSVSSERYSSTGFGGTRRR